MVRSLKSVRAPGFQGFSLHHDGEGQVLLRARLSNGRVLETTVDSTTVHNLQAARMGHLEAQFDEAIKEQADK